MVGDDDADVFYSDFAPWEEPPSAQPRDAWEAVRLALVDELLQRYRALTAEAVRHVVWPEQHRDYRAGDRNDLMVAIYRLETERDRVVPYARELEEAHLSDAGGQLDEAVHAVIVGDLLSGDDFVFLTAPLSALLGVDIAASHATLRPPQAPEAGLIVPYAAPVADPLPDHPLWSHTRDLLTLRLTEIARRDGPGIYVVDLHLDYEWTEDIRTAGIEIRWSTDDDLSERRRTWDPHPELLRMDPDAADELPWDWGRFRGSKGDVAIWRSNADVTGHQLLADYARMLDLWYSDEEFEHGDEDEIIDKTCQLAEYLQAGLPPVVRGMHDSGEIARIFGRPIPITFSSHDSHEPAWEWGREANPPELYELFGPVQERHWGPG